MYEPFIPEFSSLPLDLVGGSATNVYCDQDNVTHCSWEAEDSEYIETLNELRDNFEHQSASNYTAEHHFQLPSVTHTFADVHYQEVGDGKPVETNIYATVQKPKQVENQMTASDRSASDPPREKFPKLMTEKCYGKLNHPTDFLWNCYEQDLIQSMENIVEDGDHQVVSCLMTDSSIIDNVSSMNSSLYEQIPSMTSSIELQARETRSGQRKIVKWWDDHHGQEESTMDLHGLAEEGESINKLQCSSFLSFLGKFMPTFRKLACSIAMTHQFKIIVKSCIQCFGYILVGVKALGRTLQQKRNKVINK